MQKRWLFIEPGRMGDWVMANAVVCLFLEEHGGTVDWAVRSELVTLLKCGVPYNHVINIPSKMSAWKAMGLIFQSLRNQAEYDGCCLLTPGRSGLIVNRFVKAKNKFGYTEWKYGQGVSIEGKPIRYNPEKVHLFSRALQTCIPVKEPASYEDLILDNRYMPSLKILPDDEQAVDVVLSHWEIGDSFAVVNTGARSTFRQWPVEHWKQLIGMLLDQGLPVVIAGSPAEYDEALNMQQSINRDGLFVMNSGSLSYYATLLSKSRVLVCHDSGPMHLGAAVGTDVVAIFGPSDPGLTAPVCDAAKLKIAQCHPILNCQPCITPMNSHLEFAHCKDARKCMHELSPQMVSDLVISLEMPK